MVWLWVIVGLVVGFVIGWLLRGRMREQRLIAAYEQRLARESGEVRRLESQLDERGIELESARSGAAQAQADLIAARSRAELAEADLAAAKAATVEATERVRRLESENTSANKAHDELLEKASAGELNMTAMERDLAARGERIRELESELAALRDSGDVEMTVDVRDDLATRQPVLAGAAAPSKEQAVARVGEIARRTAGAGPVADDDLKRVSGIGPKIEGTLKELGITSFGQIARFEADDIAYVSAALDAFPGRIERDDWMSKAASLHEEKYGEPA